MAILDIGGQRIEGMARGRIDVGAKATGVIRIGRVRVGDGPGPNRIPTNLTTQMYLGERWELVFARDGSIMRGYADEPLRPGPYHLELPPQALWIF